MGAIFVAATGQNVGKTTCCLGLVAGLKKRLGSVGFMKPVGQEYVETETGSHIDKDILLFKTHFHLADPLEEMSPVLFPRGFTRDYLDGKVDHSDLVLKIQTAYQNLSQRNETMVIEGTGHTGVGSIVDLNNAQVASLLKSPVLLIASGGLGSSFDELTLNYTQCAQYGLSVAGVILNRVMKEKREMILEYFPKALKRWGIPLLGCIPYTPLLSMPNMYDFELLFNTQLLAGTSSRLKHFHHIRLVANSVNTYQNVVAPHELIITSAEREDIILATLTKFWDLKLSQPDKELQMGMILTGKTAPKEAIVEQVRKADIPMLYVPISSFIAMKMINTYTAKIRQEDKEKVKEAINTVEAHVHFDLLIERCFP